MSATLSPDLIARKARELWIDREHRFPAFVRLSWEKGTPLAQELCLAEAEARLRGRIPTPTPEAEIARLGGVA